jgi:large subunit ribosomal protein L9
MQIILLEKVRNLGTLGDEINVRAGYARNFLIPRGKAVVASNANRASFETRRAELEHAQSDALHAAAARAGALQGLKLTIARRASDEGKLFGSVTVHDVVEAAEAAGHKLNRAEVHLAQGPIKTTGEYEITITLHADINAIVTVAVVPESA